jgi:hypothetical protein
MSIDERLQFLLQSTESLHANVARLVERTDKLAETSERHEREIQRFRNAMRAALVAWLEEGENGNGPQQQN